MVPTYLSIYSFSYYEHADGASGTGTENLLHDTEYASSFYGLNQSLRHRNVRGTKAEEGDKISS